MEETKHEAWNTPYPKAQPENKKIIAGILAILFGYLGIHKFVLGYTQEGIVQLVTHLTQKSTFQIALCKSNC